MSGGPFRLKSELRTDEFSRVSELKKIFKASDFLQFDIFEGKHDILAEQVKYVVFKNITYKYVLLLLTTF